MARKVLPLTRSFTTKTPNVDLDVLITLHNLNENLFDRKDKTKQNPKSRVAFVLFFVYRIRHFNKTSAKTTTSLALRPVSEFLIL